jgi:hypothetical protein
MKTVCSEKKKTLACKIQTPGNYPEESIQHLERGESLKSRISVNCLQENIIEISSSEKCLKMKGDTIVEMHILLSCVFFFHL